MEQYPNARVDVNTGVLRAYPCDIEYGMEDTNSVDAVEKWLKEHPRKTRQSEFLEQFPKTPCIGSGEIRLYPCQLGYRLVFDSHGYKFVPDGGECETKSCMGCRENFWNEPVK